MNDVYANKPAPEEYKDDIKLWNLGMTGSFVWEDFVKSVKAAGFTTPYLTMAGPIDVSEEYTAKLKGAKYVGAGNRMFKLPKGAHRGPAKTESPEDVDAELATILAFSRYKDCFDFTDIKAATTVRAQNPYTYLAELAAKGTPFPYVFEVK